MTPLSIVAQVSRTVTHVMDRLTGDRSQAPLLVSLGIQQALQFFEIKSQCIFGNAAWIEILENHRPIWAKTEDPYPFFWVQTEFHEIVDLTASVNYRHSGQQYQHIRSILSVPNIWTTRVPAFTRYEPIGIAQAEPTSTTEERLYLEVCEQIKAQLHKNDSQDIKMEDFFDEPILCTNHQVLDNHAKSFQHFQRALSIYGLPALDTEISQPEKLDS